MAIQSFKCKQTKEFFETGSTGKAGWGNCSNVAKRKLDMIQAAHLLSDLKVPPGNSLEALGKDRAGYHSIRVNAQWRIVFKWTEQGPADVEICDYHD